MKIEESNKKQRDACFSIATIIPVVVLLILLVPENVRRLVVKNGDIINIGWWTMYVILALVLATYCLRVFNTYNTFRLFDNSCGTNVMEKETLRYNLYNYLLEHNGDTMNISLTVMWSIMVILLGCLYAVVYTNGTLSADTIFVIIKTLIVIFIFLFQVLAMHTFFERRWHFSSSLIEYEKCKAVIIRFIMQLQDKTKRLYPIPFEFEDIRSKMISRLMHQYKLVSMDEARSQFMTTSPEELFGYMSFAPDEDSLSILKALECQNFYSNYQKNKVINLIFTKYASLLEDDVTETNIYMKMVNRILADPSSGIVIPAQYTIETTTTNAEQQVVVQRTAKNSVDHTILNIIPFTDLEKVLKYMPFKTETPDIPEFSTYLYSQSTQYIGSCSGALFDENNVIDVPIIRFYMQQNRNPTAADFKKIIVPECKNLRDAILQLQNRDELSNAEMFRNRMNTILYISVFIIMLAFFKIFHFMYETTGAIIISGSVILIFVCLLYLQMFIP